jgi:hypothetical protein
MRYLKWSWIVLLFILAGCKSATPMPTLAPLPTQPSVTTEQASPTVESYPVPVAPLPTKESYPAPVAPTASSGNTAYPAPGDTVFWDQIPALLASGNVTQVTQLHSLEVLLVLKNGSTVKTVEPAIDDIFDAIEACGDPCKDIKVATE